MLKINNQENLIMLFFILIIFCLVVYVVIDKNFIDIIYLGIMIYYFIKFLIVRYFED